LQITILQIVFLLQKQTLNGLQSRFTVKRFFKSFSFADAKPFYCKTILQIVFFCRHRHKRACKAVLR